MDLSGHIVVVDLEITGENWVAVESENINETASIVEAWIRPRTQSLWTRKSSAKAQ